MGGAYVGCHGWPDGLPPRPLSAPSYADIASIAPRTGRQPPADYQHLLSRFNGLNLFYSLSVYGLRSHYDRTPEASMWQPYDVGSPNMEQHDILRRDDFVVANIGPNVDYIVMRADEDDIARYDHDTKKLQETWPSLAEFIVTETDRYATHFAPDGHLLLDVPTLPGKAPPWPQDDLAAIRPRPFSLSWWDRLRARLGLNRD